MKISILDYGVSNLKSVTKAFEHLGCSPTVIHHEKEISDANILIFPGQGAFGQSTTHLHGQHLVDPLRSHIHSGKPFFGICLGFQLLFTSSEEAPGCIGLDIYPGQLQRFQSPTLKIPQMGWNTLDVKKESPMFSKIENESYVYFVHSFYLKHTTPTIVSSTTTYTTPYVSSIQDKNVWGTQFHPEKSGDVGLQILKNFITYCKSI